MGCVKIAFTLSLHFFIQRELDYSFVIRDFLTYAGDTDTNAAIVGGILIGCFLGKKQLPQVYIDKIDNFDPKEVNFKGYSRPDDFVPKYSLNTVILNVINNAPTNLEW